MATQTETQTNGETKRGRGRPRGSTNNAQRERKPRGAPKSLKLTISEKTLLMASLTASRENAQRVANDDKQDFAIRSFAQGAVENISALMAKINNVEAK